MWEILQTNSAEDFVLGTGEAHSVREFVEQAFSYVDLRFEKYVKIDPRYFRPTETGELVADPGKARKKLAWNPKIRFKEVIKIMVDADMQEAGLKPIGEGYDILKTKFPNRWWKVD
jgi:GDPmannose 4,6-dehydratase